MSQDLDDWEDTSACVECGAILWPNVDRAFPSGPDTYLCFACAERRGGVYAEEDDRWTVAPNMAGLPDERRPDA
jgi:hypothetical protein